MVSYWFLFSVLGKERKRKDFDNCFQNFKITYFGLNDSVFIKTSSCIGIRKGILLNQKMFPYVIVLHSHIRWLPQMTTSQCRTPASPTSHSETHPQKGKQVPCFINKKQKPDKCYKCQLSSIFHTFNSKGKYIEHKMACDAI